MKLAKPDGHFVVQFEDVGPEKESWVETFFVVPDDRLIKGAAVLGTLAGSVQRSTLLWGEDEQGPCGSFWIGEPPVCVGKCRRIGDWGD